MRALSAAGLAVLVLAGCSLGSPGPDPTVSTGTPSASPSTRPGGQDLPATTAPTPSSPSGSPSDVAAPTTGPGAIPGLPTEAELSAARADVADLDLHQLAGQLVVASYPGVDGAAAAELVRTHHLGGVITLGGNVPEDPQDRVSQLTAMSEGVSAAVAEDGRDWPGFIGIDQEGGPISRIGAPLDRWPAAMALGAAGDPDLAREVATASGEQLRALGYTVVFAPDADVTTGPDDPTIGARSPGSDPGLVASISAAQARGYGEAGLVPVVKHFPGHGSVGADS
nr:beta-N-acetylhexosaminidase [Actinomycetota bacterium]